MKDDLFRNKYRIPSARLQNWDYRWDASYYITIGTAKMQHYFGEVSDKKMILSPTGVLADVFLYDLKQHHKNTNVDIYVVMPNHVHLILVLGDGADGAASRDVACNVSTGSPDHPPGSPDHSHASPDHPPGSLDHPPASTDIPVDFPDHPSSQSGKDEKMASISPKAVSVSAIMRSYKSAVTKHANRLDFDFAWHPRFYDVIIRTPEDYKRIFDYIQDNPKNWKNDKFNK